jgi:hypothetical protein
MPVLILHQEDRSATGSVAHITISWLRTCWTQYETQYSRSHWSSCPNGTYRSASSCICFTMSRNSLIAEINSDCSASSRQSQGTTNVS